MGKPTMRLGRRLYFFFSGHGIAPTRAENPDFREAALLMANATDVLLTRHIGTRTHAEYFRGRGIFDEVIMFVDCCRDLKNNVFLTPTQLPAVSSQRPPGRYFYAASTQLGSKAWERSFGGQVRGIFSKVLIDGLNDPKLCDDQRYLTGSDLAKWLYTRIPAETDKQDPEIDRYTGPQDIILFKRPPEGPPEARISFSPAYVGKTARLYQGNDTRNAVGEAEIELDWIWQVSVRVDWLYKVAVEGTPAAALFQAEEAITNVWVP
jgi:hypothetical protein